MNNKVENIKKTNLSLDFEHKFRTNAYYKKIEIIKYAFSHIILVLFTIFAIFPIYYILITSFNPIGSLVTSSLSDILPNISKLTLANYNGILFHHPFFLWMKNTLILTGTSTVIGVVLAIFSGFAMSRFNVPGKKSLLYTLLILALFPFTLMVIPFYFMFSELHLLDTYIGLIIPYSAGAVIYATYLIKNYVDAIPKDYEEAAQLDGYTRTEALFKILIPMAVPIPRRETLIPALPKFTYSMINLCYSNI